MAHPSSSFKDINRLSANVWIYDPKNTSLENLSNGKTPSYGSQSPDLVILATWMGAAARPITKYIGEYRSRFPKTSILLIRNDATDVIFKSRRKLINQLEPALDVVESIWQNSSSRILLHMFSNGGSHQARILAEMFHEKHGVPLPITGMLLDSCPGEASWGATLAAFRIGMPSFFLLRWMLLGFVHLFLLGHYIAHHVFKVEPFLKRLRKDLNDSSLFAKGAPRVYAYSKTDDMVGWKDVEAHAADAQSKGWKVRTEMFEGSRHVGHMIVDKDRYWQDVENLA